MPSKTSSSDFPIKPRISSRTWFKAALVTIIVVALIGYLAWDVAFHGPLFQLWTNKDLLLERIRSCGPLAPLAYILLQIVQTVVAPIPGQVVGSIGGLLFGWWGILWTTIGSAIGYLIVLLLSKRFGRPLLEKIFKKSAISRFDFILSSRSSALILFAIFLLPGFPDDIVCYIAGLTNLSIKKLMVIILLGRFPTIALTNYLGAGLSTNPGLVATCAVIGVLILGFAVWQRERIMKFFHRFDKKDESAPTEPTSTKQ